jgi:hypothetical protein
VNPLLLVLVLLAGGTAYYEYNWHQQSSQGFQSQIQNWENQLAQLKTENKELTALKASLSQQAEAARASYFQPANNGEPSSAPSQPSQPAPPPSLLPATGRTSKEDLGTITTITGKTYQNSKLLKIEATDIIISSTEGITQVDYANMPPDLQKKFGWDPQKSSEVNAAEIRYQEQVEAAREAAAADEANPAPATAPPNPNFVPGMVPAPGTSNH